MNIRLVPIKAVAMMLKNIKDLMYPFERNTGAFITCETSQQLDVNDIILRFSPILYSGYSLIFKLCFDHIFQIFSRCKPFSYTMNVLLKSE